MKRVGLVLMLLGFLCAGYFFFNLMRYNDTVTGRLTSTSLVRSLGKDRTRKDYVIFTGLSLAVAFAGVVIYIPKRRRR